MALVNTQEIDNTKNLPIQEDSTTVEQEDSNVVLAKAKKQTTPKTAGGSETAKREQEKAAEAKKKAEEEAKAKKEAEAKEAIKTQLFDKYAGIILPEDIDSVYKSGDTEEDVVNKIIDSLDGGLWGIGAKNKDKAKNIKAKQKELANKNGMVQKAVEQIKADNPEAVAEAKEAKAKKEAEAALQKEFNGRLPYANARYWAGKSNNEVKKILDEATDEQLEQWATSKGGELSEQEKKLAKLALAARKATSSSGASSSKDGEGSSDTTPTSGEDLSGTKKTDAELNKEKKGVVEGVAEQATKLLYLLPDYRNRVKDEDVMKLTNMYLNSGGFDLYKRGFFGEPDSKEAKWKIGNFLIGALADAISNMGNIAMGKDRNQTKAEKLVEEANKKALDTIYEADKDRMKAATKTIMDDLGYSIEEQKRVFEKLNDEDIKRIYNNAATKDAQRLMLQLMKEQGDEFSKMSPEEKMNILSVANLLFDKEVSDQDFAIMTSKNPEEMMKYINQLAELNLDKKAAEVMGLKASAALTYAQKNGIDIDNRYKPTEKTMGIINQGVQSVGNAVKIGTSIIPGGN